MVLYRMELDGLGLQLDRAGLEGSGQCTKNQRFQPTVNTEDGFSRSHWAIAISLSCWKTARLHFPVSLAGTIELCDLVLANRMWVM